MEIMKTIIALSFALFCLGLYAGPSRAPAVLDNNCNLEIPTHSTTMVNGREVLTEKSAEQVQKEQCKEIRKCMASANDEDMPELKSLEDVACNAKLALVNTKTPTIVEDKNFDGKRVAKDPIDEVRRPVVPALQGKTKQVD